MKYSADFRTKLGRARGVGAAHHGVGHWWWQRVTALALIPLSMWFLSCLLSAMLSPSPANVAVWLSSPFHTIAMVLLLGAGFFHAKLGVQVVIEDYVHCEWAKFSLLLANIFFCAMLGAVSILSVLKLHFLDMTGGI